MFLAPTLKIHKENKCFSTWIPVGNPGDPMGVPRGGRVIPWAPHGCPVGRPREPHWAPMGRHGVSRVLHEAPLAPHGAPMVPWGHLFAISGHVAELFGHLQGPLAAILG